MWLLRLVHAGDIGLVERLVSESDLLWKRIGGRMSWIDLRLFKEREQLEVENGKDDNHKRAF